MSNGIKKVSIIVSRSEIVDLIGELIDLECIEPIKPNITLDPVELTDMVSHEVMSLDEYETNKDELMLLSTQYTYALSGWIPAQSEPKLASALSGLTCSWVVEDLSPSEINDAPAFVKHPQLFGKMRSGGRKVFEPLTRNYTL